MLPTSSDLRSPWLSPRNLPPPAAVLQSPLFSRCYLQSLPLSFLRVSAECRWVIQGSQRSTVVSGGHLYPWITGHYAPEGTSR